MRSKTILIVTAICAMSVANIISADSFGEGENQFTIDFVNISGDTNPTSGYGIVNNDYRIGTYEITNDQLAKYIANTPTFTGTNIPANQVSWYEAAQFVNYLNTSTGNQAAYKFSGSTFAMWESGDIGYDVSNPYRNSNAYYFLPTEDEFVKAAYWNGTSLQTYASVGDVTPTQSGWNFYDSGYATNPYGPWDVGSGSEELNGTFNMMGNIYEWMEGPYGSGDDLYASDGGIRGGSYGSNDYQLRPSYRDHYNPLNESDSVGFRVASIPEPATLLLLGLGAVALRHRRC